MNCKLIICLLLCSFFLQVEGSEKKLQLASVSCYLVKFD